jgi:hypothetical protein
MRAAASDPLGSVGAKGGDAVKGRILRLGLALANLAALVAVSGAGNKWL